MRSQREGRTDGLKVVAAMVALMWLLEVVDIIAGHRLDAYGIHPRTADGLAEVVSAPFLHLGFGHLIGNTIPFAIMGAVIAFSGAARVLLVTALVAVVSGLGVWLFAPSNSVTIGASGLVFGYATYLLARGFFDRSALEVLVGAVVGAVWGTALIGGLVPHTGISWQGHLFGGLGGILAARVLARGRAGSRGGERALRGPQLQA